MLYPMKLTAALKDYIWGGTRLITEYHKETALTEIAESWELSCHKDGLSLIANGQAAGKALADYIKESEIDVAGTRAARFSYFPMMVKLIDARDDLSVQVHPDNAYARRVEGGPGKIELWYIVDCQPGASLLYGVSRELTREECERRIADNTLLDVCNRVPVQKGDVFYIAPGTLHAIGKGILLAEVQQSANITYRLYDYGRRDKNGNLRELHMGKALDVLRLKPSRHGRKPRATIANVFAGCEVKLLGSCKYFTAYHFALHGEVRLAAGSESCHSLTMIAGEMRLASLTSEPLHLRKGESVFLPANLGDYTVSGECEFILSHI